MKSNTYISSLPVPFPRSYWVIPGLLLAGEYPGAKESREAKLKLENLLKSGVRHIINLMEPDKMDYNGELFTPYDPIVADIAKSNQYDVVCLRFPVKDLNVPHPDQMIDILDSIDKAIEGQRNVYVHCWGGVGRTGTVVGCFLLRHGLANQHNVIEIIQRLREKDQTAHRK
ncbi:dual specificity protein phosphatase family protein [Planctomycetota bacterium]